MSGRELPATTRTLGRKGTYSKGVARRQEILERAIEVFAERGNKGTSMRGIADSLGVAHGTLQHYFDSREQLLVEVYKAAEESRALPAEPEVSDGGEVGAIDMIRRAAHRNRSVPGLVQLYTTLLSEALEDQQEVARDFFVERFAKVRDALGHRIREQQRTGEIRADIDPDIMATVIAAASDGLQTQWLLDSSVSLDDAFNQIAILLDPS